MPLSSLNTRLDQVQALLDDLEDRTDQLSTEKQNLVSIELEHMASQLGDWLKESGKPVESYQIDQHVIARKQAEQALRESEERERFRAAELEALMDAVPAIIWITRDTQAKEMVGNRFGYEFLGMWEGANISKTAPEEELVQQAYNNFKDGVEIPHNGLPMQTAAQTGVGTSNYEFDVVFDNGVTKNVLGNVVPLFDQNGKPYGAVGAFLDITERKRIENELRKSETQLQVWKEYIAFWNKATNSFFWFLQPDGSYQSPILKDTVISGKPLEETQGWNWINIIHPDDQKSLRSQWQTMIERQEAFEAEARVWHEPSQQYRWYLHKAVPFIKEGTFHGWIGASVDIQVRKEMEQVLKDREGQLLRSEAVERAHAAELEAIMEAVPTPILITRDLEGKEITGNPAAYQFLRVQPDEDLTKILYGEAESHIVKIIQNGVELQPGVIPALAALKRGEPLEDLESTIVFADGSQVSLFGTVTPMLDSDGKPTGAVGVFMDISERLAAENALRESEGRFRAMADGTPVIIWVSNANGQNEFVNRAYLEYFGVTLEQIQSEGWQPLLHPDDAARYVSIVQECHQERKPFHAQSRVRHFDGVWRWIDAYGQPRFSENGEFLGMVGSALDITEQKQAERYLHHYAKELERVNQTLQDFTSIASHDLQEPLRKVKAFGQMLNLQYSEELDEQGKDYLNRMTSAAERMDVMLKDLLDYSRVTSRGERFTSVDLNQEIIEVLSDLEARLLETGGKVEIAKLPRIQGDPMQIRQLFQNLIGNALKYHRPGVPPLVTIRASTENGKTEISVQDNGIGFDQEHADSLFEPFKRLHGRSEFEGTGMGLAICKKIVERHGGRIFANSVPGEGATFTVILPINH